MGQSDDANICYLIFVHLNDRKRKNLSGSKLLSEAYLKLLDPGKRTYKKVGTPAMFAVVLSFFDETLYCHNHQSTKLTEL